MQRIGIVTSPSFHMDVVASSVFEMANSCLGERRYDTCFVSENGGLIATPTGLCVKTEPFDTSKAFDTLIIDGGDVEQGFSNHFLTFVRSAPCISRRVAAIGAGAFALAEAGLLDGRKATTHWARVSELRSRFPSVAVEDDRIFVVDGSIWTSAGMTATWDLLIAMVEMDVGWRIARDIAKRMVMYHRRSGGFPQVSTMLQLAPKSDRIQKVLAYAEEHLRAPLTIEALARVANLSPRQFTRAFRSETGESPAKAIEMLRLEAARVMMEQGRHPMKLIAWQTGFVDRERMRRAFHRAFGQPPKAVSRTARNGAATQTRTAVPRWDGGGLNGFFS